MRVLFFAQARDVAGVSETELAVAKPLRADELWRELTSKFPRLSALRGITRLARNGEYADDKTLFSNGDEVALIPPVSGG